MDLCHRAASSASLLDIASRSRHDWTLYTHHYDSASTFPGLRDARIVVLDPQVSVRRALPALAQAAYRISRTELPLRDEQALLVSSEGLGDFVDGPQQPADGLLLPHAAEDPARPGHAAGAARAQPPQVRRAAARSAPGFKAVDRRMWKRYRYVLANS